MYFILVALCTLIFSKSVQLSYATKSLPSQVHIALAENGLDIIVTWATKNGTGESTIEYGIGRISNKLQAHTKTFIDRINFRIYFIHSARLEHLQPMTFYKYRCGTHNDWTRIYTFQTPRFDTDWSPSVGVFGDLGLKNGKLIQRLNSDAKNYDLNAVFHLGNIAYNMESGNGTIGDEFFKAIEPTASSIPYMVSPGSRDQYHYYKNRFHMPGPADGLYYSVNIGPIHFLVFSTEIYFTKWYTKVSVRQQFKWIVKDLQQATMNRQLQPWIIVLAHRPMYCSADIPACDKNYPKHRLGFGAGQMYGLENIFIRYGVDLCIWAHVHVYERFKPMVHYKIKSSKIDNPRYLDYINPTVPIHIIVGLAGSQSGVDPLTLVSPDYSIFRSLDYGYGVLQAINHSHVFFKYVSVDRILETNGLSGDTLDGFWIRKMAHVGLRDEKK